MSTQTEPTAGVFRVELPLPFELEAINTYLVPLDSGYLLVDCGMDTPQSFAALEAGMRASDVEWNDLRMVLVTHMHPDHVGLAQRIRELSGAQFLMHETEAEILESLDDKGRRLPYFHAAYTRGGVPAELRARMDKALAFLRDSLPSFQPDRLLHGGERIDSAIGPLTVIATPGHSPGHVCLYAQDRRLLFSGDHILNSITPNISWHPESDALGDYLESLETIGRLEVDEVLPSHGAPFAGHREWIRDTTAHHHERCGEIASAIKDGVVTAHGMAGRLWKRPLAPVHLHFAVFEILAHLEHMQRQGTVQASADGDGTLVWKLI